MNYLQIILDFAKVIIGGAIGGGIVAYIEWQRLRRQRSEWQRADKKIELRVLEASFEETRWSAESVKSKDEQLRIFKSKLEGKLSEWVYLVKVSVVNTTSTDLLAISAGLEIPQFDIQRASIEDQYKRPQRLPITQVYDLLSKKKLTSSEFPVPLAPHSVSGFVFLGSWYFDAPNLVDKPPMAATFTLKIDDKSEHKLTVQFESKESLEIAYTALGEMVWDLHYSKFRELYPAEEDVPF